MSHIHSFKSDYDLEEVKSIPAKLITLNEKHNNKQQWVKSRGARLEQTYSYEDTNSYIREYYNYTWVNEGREVSSYSRFIEWVDVVDENPIIFHSEDTTPDLTNYHLREINKSIRNGQIDYMEGAAFDLAQLADTLPDPFKTGYLAISNNLITLLDHYKEEIREYRERNIYSYAFENAVENETDATINDLLDSMVRPPDADFPLGLTARQSIIHQLKGVVPQ